MSEKHPFVYVAPTEESVKELSHIRMLYKSLYDVIMTLPNGRYRALAITHLESSNMWLNKHIVFSQEEPDLNA